MGHVVKINIHAAREGFTLIEMIGVMAILGILATALVPNALKAIDRAAVKAEKATVATIGESLRAYLIENEALPTSSSWPSALATYTDQNAAALQANTRGVARSLIYDPASAPTQRALLLSCMRNGLGLPRASDINTAARFQALWDSIDGEIPSTASWSSWSAWNAVDGSADFLVIERVNLRSIYLDELKPSSIAINNTTNSTTSYEIYDRSGVRLANSVMAPGASILLDNLAKGDRVLIHANSSYSSLVYSYIVAGVDRSFDLSDWIASGSGPAGGGSGGNSEPENGNNAGGNGKGKGKGKGQS